jgi:hypothetical protein
MFNAVMTYFAFNALYTFAIYWFCDWKMSAFFAERLNLQESQAEQMRNLAYVFVLLLAPITIIKDCYYLFTGNDLCFYTFKPKEL